MKSQWKFLGLQIRIFQEEKGYCLEIKNDPNDGDTGGNGTDFQQVY
jgi:hypothetical protein